jgi:hypothetical protein
MVVHIYQNGTRVHYLKNNLKYKHSGATGTQVGVVSIEGITAYYSTRVPLLVHVYHGTYTCTYTYTMSQLIRVRTRVRVVARV